MLSEPLLLDAFAPPLAPGSDRAERAVRAIEEAWAIRLVLEVTADGTRIGHDQDRARYLAAEPGGGLAFLATPDDQPHATLAGIVEPGALAPGGLDELHVHGELPPLDATRAGPALERCAVALGAGWAMLTPTAAHGTIVEQVIAPDSEDAPPAGLPRLDLGESLPRDIPRRLGWLSYWSDRVAARMGFAGAADAFASVERVASGWLVQLTREPLDLARPDHLAALQRAYEQLPAIGRIT
jgi:hypothetical protein